MFDYLDNLKFFKDPVAYDLMKNIKHIIDPKNIMNPGKILIWNVQFLKILVIITIWNL